MKLVKDIPQFLPMHGKKIRICYWNRAKLYTNCFGTHSRGHPLSRAVPEPQSSVGYLRTSMIKLRRLRTENGGDMPIGNWLLWDKPSTQQPNDSRQLPSTTDHCCCTASTIFDCTVKIGHLFFKSTTIHTEPKTEQIKQHHQLFNRVWGK